MKRPICPHCRRFSPPHAPCECRAAHEIRKLLKKDRDLKRVKPTQTSKREVVK